MSSSWRRDFDSSWWGYALLGLGIFVLLVLVIIVGYNGSQTNSDRHQQLRIKEIDACTQSPNISECIMKVMTPTTRISKIES